MANILEIDAKANVGPLQAGLNQAAATMRTTGAQMSEAFRKLEAESKQATSQISSAWVRAAESSIAVVKAKDQVRAASRAAKQADDDDTAAIANLARVQQQASAAAAEHAAALKAVQSAEENAAKGAKHMTGGVIAASSAIRTFEGHLPIRAVERFLVQTLKLGPVLQAAFPVIGALALGEVVARMIAGVTDLAGAFVGLTDALRETYREAVAGSQHAMVDQLHLRDALRETSTIGLSGLAKTNAELRNLAAGSKDAGITLGKFSKQKQDLEAELNDLDTGIVGFMNKTSGQITGTAKYVEGLKASLKTVTPIVEELTKRLRLQAPVEKARLEAESRQNALSETISLGRARVDAERGVNDLLVQGEEAYTRSVHALARISAEEEARQLKAEATEKFEIETRSLAERRALLLREQAAGRFVKPELEGVSAQGVEAEERLRQQIITIDQNLALEQKRLAQEVALARIEATRSAAEVSATLADEKAREEYEATRTASEENVTLLAGAAEKETAARLAAANALFAAEDVARRAQLAQAMLDQEKNAAQIIALNQAIENEAKRHEANLARIRIEGSREARADEKRIEDDARRRMDEEVSAVERSSNRQLQAALRDDDDRLKHHQVMLGQWVTAETAAIEEWFAKQKASLSRSLEFARTTYGQESVEYKKLQDKLADLNQQRIDKEREIQRRATDQQIAMWTQLTQHIASGFNSWIQGQKTFSQAMAQAWNGIVLQAIQKIEQIGEQWLIEHVLMQLATRLFHLQTTAAAAVADAQRTAQHTAANATIAASDAALSASQVAMATTTATAITGANVAQEAVNSSLRVSQATGDAGLAAAGTFAWWSGIDPPSAPAMASLAYAEGLGWAGLAAFDQGGLVPNSGLAMVHGGEMVLPAALSQRVQNMTGDTTTNNRSGDNHVHVHYSPTISGSDSSNMRSLLTEHADHIGRIVKRQMLAFNR